jgi:hypothetical protein
MLASAGFQKQVCARCALKTEQNCSLKTFVNVAARRQHSCQYHPRICYELGMHDHQPPGLLSTLAVTITDAGRQALAG